ncbi:MAG TPA: hypothetical protein VGH28_02575 [Polyangiaceae bacterium]
MVDEFFDEEATKRVAGRAVISAAIALFGGAGVAVVPLASIVAIVLLVIALGVAISAIRTLSHPDAAVIGGLRHVGTAAAAIAIGVALLGIAFRVFVLVHS